MHLELVNFIKSKGNISDESLASICSYFEKVTAKRNQILLEFEQVSNHYYFVNKGAVRLFTITNEGQEISRYFAFENFCNRVTKFYRSKTG
jgi:CRP-like cAMP-binding protein